MKLQDCDWIRSWARFTPDKTAFEDFESGREWTYLQANRTVASFAEVLELEYGIESGDRVAVLSTNDINYVFLFFALQRMGAILVPINFRLTSREVDHVLSDSGAKVLFCSNAFLGVSTKLNANCLVREFEELKIWERCQGDFSVRPLKIEQSRPTMILYTSGTTGAPKGAIITNQMIFWNSISTGLRLALTSEDVTVGFSPYFHTGGWNVLLLPFVHRGAKTVFIQKFDAAKVLDIFEQRSVSIFFGVPTTLAMMSQEPGFDTRDFSSIRYAVVGGEAMPVPLIETWQKRGVPVRQGYGLTEFGPNVFSLNESDSIRKRGSVGFANMYIETKVVDSVGQDVPLGEVGELLLRGPAATPGYWENPEKTEELFLGDWLRTGDLVRCDDEGHFYIVGRKKEMYISGGENVYPAEIESYLRKLQGLKEVAIIGVPDEKWGEVGRAFVVAENLDEGDLRVHCEKGLAKFKIPKEFFFLEELPKGDSGKILKRKLLDHR